MVAVTTNGGDGANDVLDGCCRRRVYRAVVVFVCCRAAA